MSKENAEKFYDALKADKTLAEEMQNALKSQKIETKEQAQQALVDFAGKKGFSFTAAELAEFEAESRELDDDELDKVNAAGTTFADYDKACSIPSLIKSWNSNNCTMPGIPAN